MKKMLTGIGNVLTTIILTAAVLVIAALIWGLTISWAKLSSEKYNEQVKAEIYRLESFFIIEYIYARNDQIHIYLYNPGKIDLIIHSIVFNGESQTVPDFPELRVMESKWINITSYGGNLSGEVKVDIYAMPKPLFNPNDPDENFQWSIVASYLWEVKS